MQVGPFVLYALAEIRQQEIERKARTAWQRQAPAVPRSLAGVAVEPLEDAGSLPAGVVACGTGRDDERALWIARHGALVVGDVMIGTDDDGLAICPANWLPKGVTRATVAAAFEPL